MLGGALGLVLGSLRLPAVILASGNAATAAGTNIAVSAAAALTGGVTHARASRVDWRIAAWMTPPSVAAAFVGGYFGGRVPEALLLAGIAAALLWSGVQLVFEVGAPRARNPRAVAALAGAVIGLIGGAVGLILWGHCGCPRYSDASASRPRGPWARTLSSASSSASPASPVTRSSWRWTGPSSPSASPTAVPGAWLGARLTGRMSERALRRWIGVALIAVACAIAVAAAR